MMIEIQHMHVYVIELNSSTTLINVFKRSINSAPKFDPINFEQNESM